MQNRTINGSIKVTWLQHKTHIIHICYPRNAAGKKWFVPWPNENTYSLCPRFVRICWLRRSEQHTITYKKHIPCSSLCRARLNHVDWGQFPGCMKCGRKANAQTILNDSQRQLTHKIHRSFIIGEPIILLLASKWPSNQLYVPLLHTCWTWISLCEENAAHYLTPTLVCIPPPQTDIVRWIE